MLLTFFSLFAFIAYIVYKIVSPKRTNDLGHNFQLAALKEFKSTSNRYAVHLDCCEFKEERSALSAVEESIADLRLAYRFIKARTLEVDSDLPVIENSLQAVLYYQHPELKTDCQLKQAFPMEISSLKYHIRKSELYLYISRKHPKEYIFDIDKDIS